MAGFMVAMIISSVAPVAVATSVNERDVADRNVCINNMKMIDSTKETSALLYAPLGL